MTKQREPSVMAIVALHVRIDGATGSLGYGDESLMDRLDEYIAYTKRLQELFTGLGRNALVAGLVTLEPFVAWLGATAGRRLSTAIDIATRLTTEPALGMTEPGWEQLTARAGVAYGVGRALPPAGDGSDPIGAPFYGRGISLVGGRASRLAHAAPPGAVLIDDFVRERLDRKGPKVELTPVWVERGRAAWLVSGGVLARKDSVRLV